MPLSIEKIRKIINEHQDLFLKLEDLDKTGKLTKLKYKKRVNFTVDEDLVREFRNYCQKNNLEMSPMVEKLIQNYLKEKKQKN